MTTLLRYFERIFDRFVRKSFFITTLFSSKSLRGQAPLYLVDHCQLIAESGRLQHRSDEPTFSLSRKHTLDLETGVFRLRVPEYGTVSSPHLLGQPDIEFGHFERRLKAFLFSETAAHL